MHPRAVGIRTLQQTPELSARVASSYSQVAVTSLI